MIYHCASPLFTKHYYYGSADSFAAMPNIQRPFDFRQWHQHMVDVVHSAPKEINLMGKISYQQKWQEANGDHVCRPRPTTDLKIARHVIITHFPTAIYG